jgi:hypothetical protein
MARAKLLRLGFVTHYTLAHLHIWREGDIFGAKERRRGKGREKSVRGKYLFRVWGERTRARERRMMSPTFDTIASIL